MKKDYSIIQELSKSLEPFKNRIELEKKGLKSFLEDLKKKVVDDKGCLIGEIIFCCDELADEYDMDQNVEVTVVFSPINQLMLQVTI